MDEGECVDGGGRLSLEVANSHSINRPQLRFWSFSKKKLLTEGFKAASVVKFSTFKGETNKALFNENIKISLLVVAPYLTIIAFFSGSSMVSSSRK